MRIEPRQLPATLPFLGDLPPLLTRLYAARGVQSEAELARDLPRSISWQVTISEGTLFVTDDRGQHELQLEWLLGER